MSDLSKTLSGLYGAYRLARFNDDGLRYFDTSEEGFWHSFKAALIVLPFYLTIIYVRWNHLAIDITAERYFLVEMIAYVIGWVAYPVAMSYAVRFINRENRYTRSIVAYNWAAVIQNIIYTPVAILNISGVGGAGLLTLIALLVILAYSWFVAKTTLDIHPSQAWLIVGLDILISMALSFWVDVLFMAS